MENALNPHHLEIFIQHDNYFQIYVIMDHVKCIEFVGK